VSIVEIKLVTAYGFVPSVVSNATGVSTVPPVAAVDDNPIPERVKKKMHVYA